MSLLNLFYLVFFVSIGGIAAIFAVRFYGVRRLNKEQLCQGLVSSRPFFADFEFFSKPAATFLKRLFFAAGYLLKKQARKISRWFKCAVALRIKAYFYRISNHMHGRRNIEKNGCSGYWEELNQSKNGNHNGGETK